MSTAGFVFLASIVVCFGLIPRIFLALLDFLIRKDQR
ncbi:hypothetical protein H4W30_002074 [Amycolatopsis roodepoortensis]|uniref:Uncharacterized protein n=1 Tax=Amycolatopsis roodepoortensis TaxID=700274 RepID=A0ABR9L3T2_9PSEU|nr:hypothetical protein [Amycolatopsis roodepoortensis]